MPSIDYNSVVVFIVIIVIIIFLVLFWWFTAEKVVIVDNNDSNISEKQDIKLKSEIFTVLVTHRQNGDMDCRIMFPINIDGVIYFYSPKNSQHLKQIAHDNRATVFTHITEGKIEKQLVFTGKMYHEFDVDNFSVHKFEITSRKISLSKTEGILLITQKLFNGEKIPDTKIPVKIHQKVKETIENRKNQKVQSTLNQLTQSNLECDINEN